MSSALPAATPWYDYNIVEDAGATINGTVSNYHNTDVETPLDTPLTAPLSGTITADSYPAWGGQVTIQADDPSQIGGHPYYFLIHMDAINPALSVGSHVNQGDFLGYSGGQYPGEPGISYPNLPAGYTHHDTAHSHSTGPHLDIGVSDSPQGSLDVSKQWSDQLVAIAKNAGIPYGPSSTTGTNPAPQTNSSACSDQCGPCDWHSPWNWPCCAGCNLASGGSNGSGQPDWKQWGNLAARAGFMLLGGAMILGGGFLAVKSLGDATGVTQKVQEVTKETSQKVQKATKTAAEAAAL